MIHLADKIADLLPEQREVFLRKLKKLSQERADAAPPVRIVPQPRESSFFSASFSQERFWFLDQLVPGNPADHIPATLRLTGPLDVDALRYALGAVVLRHESLRTSFAFRDGKPVQVIAPQGEIPLPVADLQASSEAEREAEVMRLAREFHARPFDLETLPLLRIALLRLAAEEHVLMVTLHHIIADGWSLGVLVSEIMAFYESFAAGSPVLLPPLPIQYVDFALWQRQEAETGGWQKDLEHWQRQLAGELPVLALPTDRPRPAVQGFDGARSVFHLRDEVAEGLSRVGREAGATPFMALLAAYKMFLYRLTGQTDLLIGAPIANRNRIEIEGLIGFFVNLIVLRTPLAGEMGFGDLLRRVKGIALDAFQHQDLPFERLVESLQPDRDPSHSPVFQVAFGLQNQPLPDKVIHELKVDRLDLDYGTSQYDLTLSMFEGSEGLLGWFEYSADLFDPPTILRWKESFQVLLAAALAEPERPIRELDLLTPAERHQLIREWNDTGGPEVTEGIHRLFEASVERDPDAVAAVFDEGALTYRELNARANRLARHLRRLGVGADTPVGLCVERSPAMVASLLAILKAGGAWVPLDPDYPRERLELIIDEVGMPVLVTQEHLAGNLPDPASRNLAVVRADSADLDLSADDPANPGWPVHPESLAYVIFTSGSTGKPKGVGVPVRSLVNHATACAARYRLGPADRALQFTSISFDITSEEIFPTWITGGAVVPRPPGLFPSFAELEERIARHGITVVNLPTAYWHEWVGDLYRRGTPPPPPLRLVVVGTEQALPERLAEWLELTGGRVKLNNGYASTEATVTALVYEPGAGALQRARTGLRVPVGRTISNCRAYVLNAALEPAPIGVPGDVYIAGPNVSRGYLDWPDRTAASFLPERFPSGTGLRMYRQGDRGRWLPTGELEFLGRSDDQVKIRGFRIEPGEVEAVLARHPAVKDCAVVVRTDALGLHLAGYVVPVPGEPPSVDDLTGFLRSTLPEHMVPALLTLLDALPLTINGKVDRKALVKLGGARAQARRDLVAPANPVEEVLARQWAQMLGHPEVSTRDNFFELGGHSLLAIQMMNGIRDAFGIDIPLRELFKNPTVAELARVVAQLQGKGGGGGFSVARIEHDPAARHEPFPLNDIQQAYWVGRSQSLELGGVAAHNYWEIESAELDLERITRALRKLIDRHDMLRAIVRSDGQQQILAQVPPYEIATLDLRSVDPEAVEAGLAAVRQEMSHQVLPVDRWPLFDLRAALLPSGRIRLCLSVDGLLCDAWSWRILSREFLLFYGEPDRDLPPLEITFGDYVRAEMATRRLPVYQRSLEYWRERVATLAPAPDLPLVKSLQAVENVRFDRRWDQLAPEGWQAIKERATRIGLTGSVVTLTAFAEVLATWSRSPDFTINLTLFNRLPLHPQIDEIVGDFTSLVMLEILDASRGSFEERARRVQERLWEDLDHGHVSGVQVLRELARERGEMPRAFMPVVFTSTLNLPQSRQEPDAPADDGTEVIYGITQTPQTLLDLQVSEQDGWLVYIFDGIEEPFPPEVLDEMFQAFRTLLDRLAHDPAAWQETDRLLVPQRQLAEIARVNATAAPLPGGLLHEGFLAQAARHPERPAVIAADRTLTYGELRRRAGALARRLRAQGVRPDHLVAVVMDKGWEQVVAVLAILEAGGAYLPVDASLPAERIRYLLADGEVEIALIQPAVEGRLEWPEAVRLVAVDGAEVPEEDGEPLPALQGPDDLAYVIYTSGSTGSPKGVMISHRGAVNTIADLNQRFAVGPSSRVFALSSLSFDLSVYDVFGLLAAGGSLVLPPASDRLDPAVWAEMMAREGVTHWNSVPALLELLVDWLERHPAVRPAELRAVWLSGDWIPLNLPDRLRRMVPRAEVISMGGATEASIWSILYPVGEVDPAWKSVPYGKPMANQTFQVLDRGLRPRPFWVPGDLYIGGTGLARGYWHDEDKTARSFIVHPVTGERLYRTGDTGRWMPDLDIEFLGREDLQVKIQGHRIELGEIEAVLAEHPGIASAVVAAFGERHGDKRLVGYYVAEPGADPAALTPESLRELLRRKLPEHMVPGAFLELERLPLTANGKVDRKALPEVQAVITAPSAEQLAATSGIARRVAELAAQVLKVESIDLDARLLEIGASSVDVIRIANLLEDEFGFRPRMEVLFRMSLRGALAAFYESYLERGEVYTAAAGPAAALPADSGWSALVESLPQLRDPAERERFKQSQPGLRREGGTGVYLDLPWPDDEEALRQRYLERRSRRAFSAEPVSREAFSRLLGTLRQVSLNGAPKYLYASAGGLYPLQTYLQIKPGRVEGVPGGVYYYEPVGHGLLQVSDQGEIDPALHGWINQATAERAAFSIVLLAKVDAIAPMYGHQARDFCLVEAGLIAQALDSEAPGHGIGLCQIGGIEFERIRDRFGVDASHQYVYSLLGGAIDPDSEAAERAAAQVSTWEEGSL